MACDWPLKACPDRCQRENAEIADLAGLPGLAVANMTAERQTAAGPPDERAIDDIINLGLPCRLAFARAMDAIQDFSAIDRHVGGSFDSQSNLAFCHTYYVDGYAATGQNNLLACPSASTSISKSFV